MHHGLTVILCTNDPREDHLAFTLDALKQQTLDREDWELLIVDNASPQPVEQQVDLCWHPKARIVREEELGLFHARLRSFYEAQGNIFVWLDDDNLLCPEYLERARAAMVTDSNLGAVGGKSLPRYEVPPPRWFAGLGLGLGCRDLGEELLYAEWDARGQGERVYPHCAPIGAGMVIRRKAFEGYVRAASAGSASAKLGRRGPDLASGEDNDIVMSILEEGWRVAYLPQLCLEHLIPVGRLTTDYLARYARSSNRTWVQALDIHDIRPWPPVPRWSLPLRKAKAYFATKAWTSDANYVRWQGRCGLYEGQAMLWARG